MIDFSSKVIVITGAAGGIGRESARLLGSAGAALALCDLDIDALRNVGTELELPDDAVSYHELDISDSKSCARCVQELVDRHGRIDHLIHAAGIYPERMVKDMTDAEWRTLMNINLDGTFFICRSVIPYLAEGSSIVNIASVAGHRGSYGHAHYSASKGAVTSFTKSLAQELAPRTRVNAVAPGIIATAMTEELLKRKGDDLLKAIPAQRFGTAADVAGALAFLCSDLAAYMTGETLHVNGGFYMS